MEVTGIVAEHNPFHNGHLYQIKKIRQHSDSLVIAVISGSFTQRGEAAILDKWQRALCAVDCGCDLVLELPLVFACRSAQDFARGGVSLLQRLGIVTQLAFGAETDNLPRLTRLAACLDETSFQQQLHTAIAGGLSYAQAISRLLADDEGTGKLLREPNNILGIEYLRSLKLLNASLKPLLIQRQGAGYHDENLQGTLASATAIRQALYRQTGPEALACTLPPAVYAQLRILARSQLPHMDKLLLPLQVKLLTSCTAKLQACYGINEGLENRILEQAKTAASWQGLIKAVTTKRYPSSRIARTLLYLLLELDKQTMDAFTTAGPLYARLLAAGPRGKTLLKEIKTHSSIPLIAKTSQFLNTNKRREAPNSLTLLQQMLRLDTMATELRNLACETPSLRNDFQQSPLFSNKQQ